MFIQKLYIFNNQ